MKKTLFIYIISYTGLSFENLYPSVFNKKKKFTRQTWIWPAGMKMVTEKQSQIKRNAILVFLFSFKLNLIEIV